MFIIYLFFIISSTPKILLFLIFLFHLSLFRCISPTSFFFFFSFFPHHLRTTSFLFLFSFFFPFFFPTTHVPPPFLFTYPLQQLHQQKPSNFSKKNPNKFTNFHSNIIKNNNKFTNFHRNIMKNHQNQTSIGS